MPVSSKLRRYTFDSAQFQHLTHYTFRYPAKFHPPVVRQLIADFSSPGQTILDPFGGSGTTAIEALATGRSCICTDIDPLAVFVGRAKTTRTRIRELRSNAEKLLSAIDDITRSNSEYSRRMFSDITDATLARTIRRESLWVPEIPRIQHWFRNYVIIDLARLYACILSFQFPSSHERIFLLSFASIIRNASNADPVPVSGLEVTSHMRRRDAAGRLVNPFALFHKTLRRAIDAFAQFYEHSTRGTKATFRHLDATRLSAIRPASPDAIITSPPYHNAVDYYRRHTLEMYWLDLTSSQEDRLKLLPKYIGRSTVSKNDPKVTADLPDVPIVSRWERRIRKESPSRANAFKHYAHSMRQTFSEASRLLRRGRPAVFVVGKSTWNGYSLPTADLLSALAKDWFSEDLRLWYPIKNRYMSYDRHNGASIDREYVVVLRRH